MSKHEQFVKRQIADERSRQFYDGVHLFLFELIPAFAQAAILIACAFVFCGCIGG